MWSLSLLTNFMFRLFSLFSFSANFFSMVFFSRGANAELEPKLNVAMYASHAAPETVT
jgi:hypothetical protein